MALSESQEWFARQGSGQTAIHGSSNRNSDVFRITDLIGLIRRGRKVIVLTVAATTLLALGFGILSPKRYTAEADLYIDSRGYRVLSNDVRPMTDGNQSLTAEFETELKIITSGDVLARVVRKERLVANREFNSKAGLLGTVLSLIRPGSGTGANRELAARRQLQRMVTITRSDRSFVAGVQVTTSNPQLSARLAQAIAETYLEQHTKSRQDLTRRLATEVTGRLQDLREKVSAAEKRLATYQRNNNLVSSAGVLVSDQDLTELNKQLNDARARAARAKAQLDQIRRLPRNLGLAGQTQVVLNSPTLVQLQVRYADARRSLAELRRNLGDQHPNIKAAQARVSETRNAVYQEIQRQRKAIANDYEQARVSERSFQSRINRLKRDSSNISETLIGARELKRAVEANRKVYEEFLVRARELTEQQSIAPSSSRIITKAEPPAKPNNLPLRFLLLAGFLLGLPAGIGMAFLKEAIAETSQQPDNGHLGQAAAGHVAQHERQVPAQTANENFAFQSSGRRAMQPPPYQPAGISDRALFQIALPASASDFVRSTRLRRVAAPPNDLLDLAMQLQRFMDARDQNLTIIFDYGDAGASSTFAAGISASLSYQGYDVLLADGDYTHAGLASMLSLRAIPGLFDQFHQETEKLVLWNKPGLPHILASLAPEKRFTPQGVRRYLDERLEDLSSAVEHVVIYAGDLTANPFAGVLLEHASQAIAVGPGDARQSVNAAGQMHLLADYGVPVIACINSPDARAQTQPDISGPAPAAPEISAHAEGQNDNNKKRWNFRRKRVVA